MTSRQNPNPHVPQLSGWRTWVAVVWAMVVHATTGWATHNRAGEITYTHVQGLTYEVVITTYTKSDALADRPFLFLRWGDETETTWTAWPVSCRWVNWAETSK